MTAHLLTDDTAPAAVFPAAAGWHALSAAMTDEVPVIADRDDLLVTIAPGAGHGAPACFLPAHATIEVDGTHLGTVDPGTATPLILSDRDRYKTAWGLLTHECAHARHSTWQPPPDATPGEIAAADLIEEARIEAAQIRRRPDDRHWLRGSATNLILADTHANDPAAAPKMTPRDAAQSAALLLARADAGILTATEVAPVAAAVEAILGTEKVAQLRALWREAFTLADDDGETMIKLGRQWCEIVGTDPDTPTPPGAPGTGAADPTGHPSPSPLAEAILTSTATVAAAVACEAAPPDPAARATAARQAETKAEQEAADAARLVFSSRGRGSGGSTRTRGTRPPTTEERLAARVLGRALSTAGIRDRVTTKKSAATPPGRLRMRGALAADAQRAAGALPTAEPFTRITRATVPAPPLRLGIACDVSGSMQPLARPVASTAWILAHAAHHANVPAETATVIFGHHVRPITHPGQVPAQVTEFAATDNWENIATAIDALDGALGLTRPGAARLLVIVSDGHYVAMERELGQQRLTRLRASGCAVLWLTSHPTDTPLSGGTVHQLTDPTATAQAIGRAATAALRAV